ncbi:MAG: 50S ribosomal protein L21 [Clostridia bacterium]|nr:50S ribosomal protein L21 [Clostridia bacterium]MBR2160612.1 50S ribosomal protein L21 [Clostridia bacterium]MBR2323851.1 50S ribosomal protein L21 [Clostridia bacterium]MBR2397159.1 50S ribosomal protein L21 [Clostridia bacterium]MBR2496220.1 50S ribosomal protein L21 [Clostridia bacterium]
MYAVIVTGGKQYKVAENDLVKVEKLNANVGDTVELDAIMVSEDGNITTGNPVEGVKVSCEVLRQDKEKKVIIFKMKSKKNERRRNGHRQPYTLLKVLKVVKG